MHYTANPRYTLAMAILILTYFSQRTVATDQCAGAMSMLSKRFRGERAIPTEKTADLKACFDLCRETSGCGSINYEINEGVCELNSKNHLTHPQDLEEKDGYIYLPVLDIVKQPTPTRNLIEEQSSDIPKLPEPKYKTCAKLKDMKPSSPSGVYELEVNGVPKAIYCDMDNFGGGWSLVVSISGSNNQHTLQTENNCLNSSYCVPLTTGTLVARKRSDSAIRALASDEGTFRFDVISTSAVLYNNFYRITQGAQVFDAGCAGVACPRIIISYAYPYVWESNCKGIDMGYQIAKGNCHKVFDGHDSGECGSSWHGSKYPSKRVLYSYCTTTGIWNGQQGYMFVR